MKVKKSGYRIISTLIMVLLMISIVLPTAFAAPDTSFEGISFNASCTEEGQNFVNWRNIDGVYYLFIPSCVNLNELELYVNGTAQATLDDTKIVNGEKTSILSDLKPHTVSANGQEYSIVAMQSSNIGSMYISTESGSMDYIDAVKGNAESGHALILDADGSIVYDDALDSIKGRGNSTWECDKKPYNLKLANKADLFGMGKSKKWSLLANHYDESLIRNSIMYDLADEVGILSEDNVFVDLYLNGNYNGTYLLTEKIEIEETRVDIQNLADLNEEANEGIDVEECPLAGDRGTNPGARKYVDIPADPEDITGGYLLEFDFQDRYAAEVSGFVTNRGQCVVVKEPEFASKAEVDYIADYFQDFEDALYSDSGYNAKGKHYSEYCDIDSLARQYLIQELSLNIDAAVSSFYFYKDSDLSEDNMMYCDPTWDYDATIANFNDNRYGYDTTDPTVWYVRNSKIWQNQTLKSYLAQAYSKEDIYASILKSWNEDFLPALDIVMNGDESSIGNNGKLRSITEYIAEVYDSAKMNFTLWDILEFPSRGVETGKTIEENIDYIRNFFNVRVPMMKEEFKVAATGIELDSTYAKLSIGEEMKIQPKVLPSYATNKEVSFSSSNPSVATVDDTGTVKAVGAGSATITVKTVDGGFEAAFKLDIVPALTAISISAEKTSASVGEKIALTVEAIPQGAELKDIIWSVDNEKIASIDDSGILSALSKGKVHVTASVKDNPLISNSIEIEVVVDAESLTISGPTEVVCKETEKYEAIVSPSDASNKNIIWSVTPITGDGDIEQDGSFTATKPGRVLITAVSEANNEVFDSLEISVIEKIECEDFEVTNLKRNLSVGEKGSYQVEFLPNDCNESLSFSSSNPEIFKVDMDGNWEAIAKGEVKLVAKCGNITKTYAITINEKVENPDNTGNASEETNQPKTGDSNNMWIWIVVIALAVAVIVALLVVRHVRSKKK